MTLPPVIIDLYRLSKAAKPFILRAGFPPKQLLDPRATIKDAGLAGASIEHKLA